MTYDVIIIGLGGMGSAAAYHFARRGCRVLGLEQYPLGHDRGSSHGHTRIIRTAYYEHPDYIPFVRRAFSLWHDLEQVCGKTLLVKCDCLSLGPASGVLIQGVSRAAKSLADGAVETLTSDDVVKRFPFQVSGDFEGRLEHEAGFLYVTDCVRAHLEAARAHGAVLQDNETVQDWTANDREVTVTTNQARYHAANLVVTAGAWATKLLATIGIPLQIMRQTMHWFTPHEPARFRRDRFPIFMLDTPLGEYYGLPMIDIRGVKIARHYGSPELVRPDDVDWAMHGTDLAPIRSFVDHYLPNAIGDHTGGQVCLYTLSPDRHFIIDHHPRHENVCVAAGFSGHGFKFASAVGELLAELTFRKSSAPELFSFRARSQ